MRPYSLTAYRALLETAQDEGWRFCRYADDLGSIPRALLLRHDVDYSIDLALEVARVNASVGVAGTFFLLLRSDLYNLLAPRNLSRARDLAKLGQRIGLHFAAIDPVPADEREVVASVLWEMDVLRREIPEVEPVVAWHNPTTLWLQRYTDQQLPGLLNAYDSRFTKRMCYRSDSNFRNSIDDFETVIRDPAIDRLHLLFHPLNWSVGGGDMLEILAGTWRQVIREREEEFGNNRVHNETFPAGMPADVLEPFIDAWFRAARNRKSSAA